MTARTLVPGGGSWSTAGSWSPSGVPTASDVLTLAATSGDLIIDGTSGSPNLCQGVTISGYAGNISGTGAYITVGGGTAAAFQLSTTGTFVPSTCISTITFASTVTGNTFQWVTSSGGAFINYVFSGVGGGWTATTDLTAIATGYITHTAGSLVLNTGNQLCTGYSGTGTTTRSLSYSGGANTWTIENTALGGWDITTSTNMALSVSSLTIAVGSSDFVFNGGGLTYGALICTAVPASATMTINQANTFSSVTLSGSTDPNSAFIFGGNQTCTGTWTGNGTAINQRLYYCSSTKGTARTISAATFSFTNIDLEDIAHGGAGSGNISGISGGSGDCTGNSGWTFTTPQTNYWVPASGTSTGSESATTNWASSSGGTPGTGRSPLPQDTAIFDAHSIDAGSRIITQDIPRIGTHIWTGVTNTPEWYGSVGTRFYGSVTLASGMTLSGFGGYTYAGEASSTLDTEGLTFCFAGTLLVDCSSAGILVIPEGVTSSAGSLIMYSGTIQVLGTFETDISPSDNTGGTIQLGVNGLLIPFKATAYPEIEVTPGLTNTIRTIGFSSVTPATGQQGAYIVFPVNGTITGWSIVADSGTATVDTWKIGSGTTAPTSTNSISTSGVSLSSGSAIVSSTVTDFTTTTVTANDIFAFNLSAVSGATKIEFQLQITVS